MALSSPTAANGKDDGKKGQSQARKTAQARYEELAVIRQPYLDRARDCSSLTLPYLIPPDDMPTGQKLPSLFQSVGANGVTNLASKLLLTMLPPNEPCFRLRINDMVKEREQEEMDASFIAKVEQALSRVEQAILADIEATSDRPVVNEGNMHLIVGGNVLYHNDGKRGLRMFPLSRFVVDRDSMGTVVEILVKEEVSPKSLPADFMERMAELDEVKRLNRADSAASGLGDRDKDREVALYTWLTRESGGKLWSVHQECFGQVIPGTKGSYKADECPWFPVRMYCVAGEPYGRSFVEQQIGDLNSLESLNQALVEASVVSAKILTFVNPNGFTEARAVAEAENGAVLEGNAEDVSLLQVQKGGDLNVVAAKIDALERSIKTAFLMMDGVRRDKERVTAEEIRTIARELEAGLGGVYTIISQEFQLPYIRCRMAAMTKEGRLPELPKDLVSPSIVTGFEAIGRGNDKDKLVEFLQFGATTFQEGFLQFLNPHNAILRLAAAMGLQTEGLIKSEEEMQQEQQQAKQEGMQQMMLEKLGPEALRQGGQLVSSGMQMQGAQPQ